MIFWSLTTTLELYIVYYMTFNKQLLNDTIQTIKRIGTRYPKRHGEWYCVNILGHWITLDTWNSRIALHTNLKVDDHRDCDGNLVCFTTTDSLTLGFNFGVAKTHHLLNFWRIHLKQLEREAT